jgi:hypothetical protein
LANSPSEIEISVDAAGRGGINTTPYQGTFFSRSNLTANASKSAMMTAHSSIESRRPVLGLVD